jgi:cathepsin B
MKIFSILLLATLLSARKLIPLTEEKKEFVLSQGFDVDENAREVIYDEFPTAFPIEFDTREKWPHCLRLMPNEGECLASWAIASSSVMSDKFCITSNLTANHTLSAQYLVSCMKTQGGCKNKHKSRDVFDYFTTHGLPTQECVPYVSTDGKERECSQQNCIDEKHNPFFVKKCNRTLFLSSTDAIKQELYRNGPVYCTFDRYSDFDNYKSGIYYMVPSPINNLIEQHRGVKVFGWGVENEIHFWIVMNSWGDKWGENGNFRIRMGEVNICQIAASCEPILN